MPKAPRQRGRGVRPRVRITRSRAARAGPELVPEFAAQVPVKDEAGTGVDGEVEPPRDKAAVPPTTQKAGAVKTELALKAEPDDGAGVIDVEDAWKPVAWQPAGWEGILAGVRAMRARREAPVDSMGCERAGAREQDVVEPRTVRYQHLVALMLSSQTRDEVTAAAVDRLRAALQPTLTADAVLAMPEEELAQVIYPVGFYRRKAVYLRDAARICVEEYGGDVPRNLQDVTRLPGVGPKMGHLLLQAAWGDVQGIGVDVHVHRLANLWRWVPRPTRTPEQTREALEAWLPRELWAEINPLLVGFGQTWCPPRLSAKACAECDLSGTCPSAKRGTARS